MNDPKKRLETLSRTARRWADDGTPAAAPDANRAGAAWDAIERRLPRERQSEHRRFALVGQGRGRPAAWLLAPAVSALLLGLGWGGWTWYSSRHAPVVITETIEIPGGDAEGSGDAGSRVVRFSDGSSVALAGLASAEVVATDEKGAHLRLASGKAHFDVRHRKTTSWRVDAGPFAVLVHGTVFDVKWTPATGAFDVSLFEGVVGIRGPLPGGELTLRAGQRLGAVLPQGTQAVTRLQVGTLGGDDRREEAHADGPTASSEASSEASSDDTTSAEASPHEAPPGTVPSVALAAEAGPGRSQPAARSHARSSSRGEGTRALAPSLPSVSPGLSAPRASSVGSSPTAMGAIGATWRDLVARGDFGAVLREADEHGIERCLEGLSLPALGALVDASRYGRRTDVALRALEAERTRFPGSPAAAEASFLSGRLTDDNLARPAEAIRWYERYLAENAGGRYAADALGRLMLAEERLGNRAAAREAARRYLGQHPGGAYAESARRLVGP